ncbi:MAG: diphthine--ammonia ligase [Nanopusillaceae archaeon]
MGYAVLFSGGKDSNYALYLSKKENKDIKLLLSAFPEEDSYLFHHVNIEIVDLQAKSMNLPLYKFYTNTKKELEDLEKVIYEIKKDYNITGIVCGVIKSKFQYERIRKICEKFKLDFYAPLWQINEKEYIKNLIDNKFEVLISGFFAYPFKKELLGKILNYSILEELEELNNLYGINIAGEGGEIETTVLYQPLFKKKIIVDSYEIIIGENYGIFKIKKAHLE